MQIALNRITLDHRAQPRASLDIALVNEYAELMRAGVQFPDLKVFFDGKRHYLADGFHRHPAALAANFREFGCNISDGTLRDAILYSCKANAAHGLRRSDEDKRRAVKALLEDGEWGQWSDREIARQCAVSHPFVARIREALQPAYLETLPDRGRTAVRSGGEPYTMKTAQIGQRAVSNDTKNTVPLADPSGGGPVESECGGAMGAPPPHAAVTFLARSISEIKATARQIVESCEGDEARDDLRETCSAALAKLGDVLDVLESSEGKIAA